MMPVSPATSEATRVAPSGMARMRSFFIAGAPPQ